MSCKRTKSSKTSAKNLIVIQNEEIREKFGSIFMNQPMMAEKCFNLESNDKMIMLLSIRKRINALNWEQFCDAFSMPDEDLVQKFYANLTMSDANEFLIHKKKVPLTFESINDLFNFPDFEKDDYYTMMTNIK
ncbi:hypothetical protein ES288_D09G048200v1 [Gossypium darwinii]|uniref:Uncharacterized protein n=1 Tax=Gossypium darwinii TaxID=34276 RepID=A0A5D2B5M1_GOSDA|nr:hypothetical protein ES288_D09G048200v1 [Gossypium darwinii]